MRLYVIVMTVKRDPPTVVVVGPDELEKQWFKDIEDSGIYGTSSADVETGYMSHEEAVDTLRLIRDLQHGEELTFEHSGTGDYMIKCYDR